MRKRIERINFVAFVFLAVMVCSSVAFAQQVNSGTESGFPPYGSFGGSSFDTVLLENGNLHVGIPLVSVKERGRTFKWKFVYDAPMWQKVWTPTPTKQNRNLGFYSVYPSEEEGDWRLTSPTSWTSGSTSITATCPTTANPYTYYTGYYLQDPDGTKHQFPFYKEGNGTQTVCNGNYLSGPALDGSGVVWNLLTGIATLKDGTQINLSAGSITDANGNLASGTSDMLGRDALKGTQGSNVPCTTPLGVQLQCPQYTWTYLDSNGKSESYQLQYGAFDIQTNLCGSGPTCYEYKGTQIEPVKLTLPDGTAYVFSYENDSLLQLSQISLPTGGSIAYTYSSAMMVQQPGGGHYPNEIGIAGVASRTVKADGASSEWTYGPNGTVTDPLGNQQVHNFSKVGVGNSTSASLVETSASYYQGSASSGKLLKTVSKSWTGEPDPNNTLVNLRVVSQTTVLDNGQESQDQTDFETFQYNDTASGVCPCTAVRFNPTEKREYAYGSGAPGPLLRRTDYAYLHTGNQTYLNLNLVDKLTGLTTYNGSGAMLAETKNEYDNYTQGIQSTSAVQHSSSFNSSYKTRGNLTAIERWNNSNSQWLTTRSQYNDVGDIISTTDPKGNLTSFGYTDSWTNSTCAPSSGSAVAYVTKITNALNQFTTSTYDSCTGAEASSTDANGQPISHTYDLYARPLTDSYPDGGSTTNCYTDDPGGNCYANSLPLKLITTRAIASGQNLINTTIYDDLGRVSQAQLADPEGTDYTDTTYDADGRLASVSNPFRSTSDPTYGIARYSYDGLDRTILVVKQDGSHVQTAYCGNSTLVTDEQGKWRHSTADSLGRLIELDEPSSPSGTATACSASGANVTTYGHDALNNLTSVSQIGSRSRSFVYDSLSRLTSSTNPESGAITYTYDNDGNVQMRIDARGIKATYSYDALDRVTQKVYTDGTPTVNFLYDVSADWGNNIPQTNVVGRLAEEWTVAGTVAYSGSIFGYDQMGRTVMNDQCTPLTCGPTNYPVGYTYDLLGDMTSYTNGAGQMFTQAFDSAGRVTSLTSNVVDAQHPATLATVTQFFPSGTPELLNYGNNLHEVRFLNNRLQTCRMSVNTNAVAPVTLQHCNDNTNYATLQDFYLNYNEGSTDNGNVSLWNANYNQVFSRTYTYDQVNRLTSMADADTVAKCQGATWTYDTWGNRLTQTPTKGSCGMWNQGYDTTNRITGWSYDAAGNLLNDHSHSYTYDAENRITAVDGGATATYLYDAEGRRVEKKIGSVARDYVYNLSGQVVAEMGSTGLEFGHIYLGNSLVAEYENATTYFIHSDHLGSTRLMTQMNGTPYDSLDFMPFGEQISGDTGTSHKFEGKERDAETSNDDFGARYYSSSQGRWMSADWSAVSVPVPYANLTNPQTLNLYSMVSDNPVSFADLDGHHKVDGTNGSPESSTICPQSSGNAGMSSSTCRTATLESDQSAAQVASQEQAQQQAQQQSWSFSWQVNASLNFLGGELKGVADTTVTPLIQTVEHPVDAVEGAAHAIAHPIQTAENVAKGAVDTAKGVASGNPRAIGQVAGLAISTYVAVRGAQGAEIKFSDDLRIAPTGNRTGGIGELPHYHRRIVGPSGKTVPGGGIGWHRPWEP